MPLTGAALWRSPEHCQEFFPIYFAHPQTTQTTTLRFWTVPAGRTFVIDRVLYGSSTGLAANATNAFRGELKCGSNLIATVFNTDSDDNPAGASLVAGDLIEILAAQLTNRRLMPLDVLTFVLTEDGTATLAYGFLIVEGRLC